MNSFQTSSFPGFLSTSSLRYVTVDNFWFYFFATHFFAVCFSSVVHGSHLQQWIKDHLHKTYSAIHLEKRDKNWWCLGCRTFERKAVCGRRCERWWFVICLSLPHSIFLQLGCLTVASNSIVTSCHWAHHSWPCILSNICAGPGENTILFWNGKFHFPLRSYPNVILIRLDQWSKIVVSDRVLFHAQDLPVLVKERIIFTINVSIVFLW